ncbi:nucleoredoxin-like [Seminavis robusta]|uniref:Nucleoredoxin-like n=1 Tax=Seminavis robusta TaxID=568900 RepID=A0A9N8DNA3_9STRA|nr:nucleoredoxin-like [Seminavis robusta]|eukprot:Sro173_g076310.1 nucleoredoxin-like (216) ;mRNA; r:43119-43766
MLNFRTLLSRPVGSLLVAAPLATAFLAVKTLPPSSHFRPVRLFSSTGSTASDAAVSSLPRRLLDPEGNELSSEHYSELLSGKRVAYYMAAGWCPMCTSFEPSLLQFRQAARDAGKGELALIYVPSDRSQEAALQRASAFEMLSVPFGDDADEIKRQYNIWSGSESLKFGFGRRSGVPALVVLSGETGEELAFLPAEAQGVKALQAWPLEDDTGVW